MASDLMNMGATGKYYKVQQNGKAQKGLSVGDRVVTDGGTYQILAVNPDGSYKSALYDENMTTRNYRDDYENGYNSNNSPLSGIGSVSDSTKEKYDSVRGRDYMDDDRVSSAQERYDEIEGDRPSAYDSAYRDRIEAILSEYENRDPFTYNLSEDMLYQQYKDQYQALGQLAMADTVGQAAALTGGYGNSYAANAGSQAYQSYLRQLNEMVPSLYSMALNKYNMEGEDMLNQLGTYQSLDDSDYNRWLNDYNAWLNERNNAYGMLTDEINRAQSDYYNDLSQMNNIIGMEREDYWNDVAQDNTEWEQRFSEEQFDWQKAVDERDYNLSVAKASRSGSGSSGGSSSKGKSVTADMIDEAVMTYEESGDEGLNALLYKWAISGYSDDSLQSTADYIAETVPRVTTTRKTGVTTTRKKGVVR